MTQGRRDRGASPWRRAAAVVSAIAVVAAIVLVASRVGRLGAADRARHLSDPTANPSRPVQQAAAAATMPLPADCRPTAHPPPTEYGLVATITEGSLIAPAFRIDGLTAQMCGVIRIVSGTGGCTVQGQVRIPSDGVVLPADLGATLTVVPGRHPKIPANVHVQPVIQLIPCGGSSANGLALDMTLAVDGRAGVFGLGCSIPLTGTVHTVVTGDLFSGNYQGSITLTGKAFRAGQVANNDRYCPGTLPGHVNTIAQLPAGNVSVSMSGTVAIYQNPQ